MTKCVIIIFLSAFCLSISCCVFPAADRETAFDILNAWTCVRWGEDNIAWVVHYPEELVEPWIRSEAEKQKMRPEQMEELRKSFSDELRIGSATAVLLSVYGYGGSPINLSPVGQNIVLINSSGKRVSPIVFEKKLDSPISGLVQGFVFFPLQTDKNFSITMKGLVPERETNFAFSGTSYAENSVVIATASETTASHSPDNQSQREVVVRIPTRRTEPSEAPLTPTQPVPTAMDMSDFGDLGEVFPATEPIIPPTVLEPPVEPRNEIPKLAPRQVLDIYLRAWVDGDAERMYSLLSTESQGRISRELFAREVTSGGFRNALRSGYKINWVGDSARVTVAKKVLFVRTLETKQINFITEDGSARVSW